MTGKQRLLKLIDDRLPLDRDLRAAVAEGIEKMSDQDAAREADALESAVRSLCGDVAAMESAIEAYDALIAKLRPKD